MHVRRGLAALTVSATLLSGVSPVFAQVDEAERRAGEAAEEAEAAYAVVSSAVADAEAVEAALFVALDEYQAAATELTQASVRLERLTESLAFADAQAVLAKEELESHTVTAYMEAVAATASVVLDTDTVESALVVGQVVRESQADALATLGDLVTQRNELQRLRAEHAVEVAQVESLEQRLAARTGELEAVLVEANADVAAAFTVAAAADAEYRAALDDVERAIAEEEAARRAAAAATTTTTTVATAPPTTAAAISSTTAAGQSTTTTATTTTTTVDSDEGPPIPLNDRVLAWRPVVEAHFAADLVGDALVIIQCESLGDPEALNPYSGAAGLFQFLPGTWAVASVKAGVGGQSVFDGEANIIAASWLAEYYRARTGNPWRPWSCHSHL